MADHEPPEPRPQSGARGAAPSSDARRGPLPEAGRARRLDPAAAARFHAAIGEPFDDVAVHVGPEAAAFTSRHQALALSAGRSIAFSAGAYRPGTLRGDVLLAHELAHVVGQRGAHGPPPSAITHDASAEAAADGAAMGMVGRALGWTTGLPRRAATAAAGLQLRACRPGSSLSSGQRAAADAAATRAFGDVPELLKLYHDVYGGKDLRVGDDVPAGLEAETKYGTTTLATASLSFGAPRLGALLVHELSHVRDPSGSPLGLGDAVEGFAYAFEIMILQRLLERATMTPPERAEVAARVGTIGSLYSAPPALPALATAFRENFDDLLGALQILFRIVDGKPMTWGPSGPPPSVAGLTPATAGVLIRTLLTTDSDKLRAPGTPTGDLLQWVHAHAGEVSWLGIGAALATVAPVVPPAPSSPAPPAREQRPETSPSSVPQTTPPRRFKPPPRPGDKPRRR